MRERFEDADSWRIWNGESTKGTRRLIPENLHAKARMALNMVVIANRPQDLEHRSGFKMLHGRLSGVYQFRLQGSYRVRFAWKNGRAMHIQCGEYHNED